VSRDFAPQGRGSNCVSSGLVPAQRILRQLGFRSYHLTLWPARDAAP
jgi:hypothetical protein